MASLDIIGAISLTGAASFLVGTIAAAYPGPLPARLPSSLALPCGSP